MLGYIAWLGILIVAGLVMIWAVRRRREREFSEARDWRRFVSAFTSSERDG